jgi:hypothetical protein
MKHIDIQVSNVLYVGHEILKKRGNVLISFFLEGLLLEGKFMLLLKFICYCLGVYLKLCLWLNLI